MSQKTQALFKLTGSYGESIGKGSCGECNKTYKPEELKEKEEKLDNGSIYNYRLSYECPEGHLVLAADVEPEK